MLVSLPSSAQAVDRLTLRDALEALRDRGLPIVYSSSLVPPDLLVSDRDEGRTTPAGRSNLRASLREEALALLAPHGLTLEESPLGIYLVVLAATGSSNRARVALDGKAPTPAGAEAVHRLDEATEEIVVSTPYSILGEEVTASVNLDRRQILELPHFGDDLNRAVRAMPAASGNEASARFNVRGGRYDEVLVSLDGLELFAPFHLEDLTGIFSILDPEVIDRVDLFAGAFPTVWGDRMTAVLDMRTRTPTANQLNAGVSFSNAWLGGARRFAGERGSWLASARRGYLDLVLDFVDEGVGDDDGSEVPEPRYWDVFSKLDFDVAAGSTLSFEGLVAGDSADFRDSDDPTDQFSIDSRWRNQHLGLTLQQVATPKAMFVTVASYASVERDRVASERAPREEFDLDDERMLEVLGLRQTWTVEPSNRHLLTAGAEIRRYDADYDYRNDFDLPDPIDDPRFFSRTGFVVFDRRIAGNHTAAHASDRMRLGRLTLEAGARFDQQTWLDDDQWSPRLGGVLELDSSSALRFGWGRFFQSQRPHELAVEFGDDRLFPAAMATHWTLGYERRARYGSLRADAYMRRVSSPHPRYETLFDPFVAFPEVAADRILIEADRADARGVELSFHRRGGEAISWWISYSVSEVFDRIGNVDQRRSIDQTHALTANLTFKPTTKWTLDWLWTYHSGWPSTTLTGELVAGADGRLVILHHVGPFYEERLADYHRLDLRASRATRVGRGELRFFVDVQNLYDRENDRGRDLEDEQFVIDDGVFGVDFPAKTWFGIIPSIGVSWRR